MAARRRPRDDNAVLVALRGEKIEIESPVFG
jgi:hypothetical protein